METCLSCLLVTLIPLRSFDGLCFPLRHARKRTGPPAFAAFSSVPSSAAPCCMALFQCCSWPRAFAQNQDFQILERECLQDCFHWAPNESGKSSQWRQRGSYLAEELDNTEVITTTLGEGATHSKIVKQHHQMTQAGPKIEFRQAPRRPDSGTSLLYSNVFPNSKKTTSITVSLPRLGARAELVLQEN